MPDPTVICLTPVKNEAWILDRFLTCASLWADHIIVADQGSDDGSREIARRFPKVRLIENGSSEFNEPDRQKLLIAAARELPGPRLLIALDADEFLPANFRESRDWAAGLRAEPGTVIRFRWAVVLPDLCSYYVYPHPLALGFMDDGSEHVGEPIHSPRVPTRTSAPVLEFDELRVLHFSVADLSRFRSKLRWYQCWEWLNRPERRSAAALYRFYHKDLHIPPEARRSLPDAWFAGYRARGADLLAVPTGSTYRWDADVLRLLEEHGTEHFRRLDIWDADWSRMAAELGIPSVNGEFRDPRTAAERLVHRWLHWTQPHYSHFKPRRTRARRAALRAADRVLNRMGW